MIQSGTLYITATPIGNLEDITLRAVRILGEVDYILAEDTRVTGILLSRIDVHKQLISMNGYSEEGKSDRVISDLLSGKNIALVSDAGTPCISDPGYILVKKAVANGITVTPLPGANAAVSALSISGLPTASFSFFGFLPRKDGDIAEVLERVKSDGALLAVFYESPLRIIDNLEHIRDFFPDANAVVCNDLTKKFERIYRGSISAVIDELKDNANSDKGEYTVVIEKNLSVKEETEEKLSIEALIADKLAKGVKTVKEAVALVTAENADKLRKKDVYSASLRLKEFFYDEDEK